MSKRDHDRLTAIFDQAAARSREGDGVTVSRSDLFHLVNFAIIGCHASMAHMSKIERPDLSARLHDRVVSQIETLLWGAAKANQCEDAAALVSQIACTCITIIEGRYSEYLPLGADQDAGDGGNG